ncbi:hypothetical protein DdX_07531 [Ditylenchus destructor]|uniref:Uncharacterized protein n=1 Tax=Ditylenchus destructor TaxID=166010 RepID=A0AAD4R543_9BILA|nr:hypothetical protein DdX_07531 [Ditylenchus destructor]
MTRNDISLNNWSIKFNISFSIFYLITTITLWTTCCKAAVSAAPKQPDQPLQDKGRLTYTITAVDQDDALKQEAENRRFLQALEKSPVFQSLVQTISKNKNATNATQNEEVRARHVQQHSSGQSAKRQHNHNTQSDVLSSDARTSAGGVDSPLSLFSLDTVSQTFGDSSLWKKTLFGPSGLLTEVFNLVNDKRKEGLEMKAQADLPADSTFSDFSKILDTLLLKNQNGNFDEPLPELPFIGICNRLNCGDIYKAVDEFRKSEMFSNFQTAMSLIHDPKGWDIIGDLLANPDLIENFVGKSDGSAGGVKSVTHSKGNSKARGDLKSEDGNIGIDFSSLVDGTPEVNKKSVAGELPEIASSIDAPDYYSSIDKVVESKVPERANGVKPLTTTTSTITTKLVSNLPMPEISESIDGPIDSDFESFMEVNKEEIVNSRNQQRPQETVAQSSNISHKHIIEVNNNVTAKSNALQRRFFQESGQNTTSNPITTTTSRSYQTSKSTTALTPHTTRKNFRRDNDYYAMYYDNG